MARIVQIGKRRWLAGLDWSSFEDAPSKDELRADAQRFGASWSCVRKTETAIQAGFCASIDINVRPVKLYSLAAMLGDSHEQPWSGIFKIEEDVWWYIAVRDGNAIMPEGDVIGSEAEVQAARERHAIYSGWKFIDGDISLLEELITGIDAKPTPVRALASPKLHAIPNIVVAITLVMAVGGGYLWWHQKQQAEEQERAAAMARIRAQMLASQSVVSTPLPLMTMPLPNDWLAACGNVISVLPLSKDGWMLDQVSCDITLSTIYWVRKEGATVAHKPEGKLSMEGNKVVQVFPLTGLNTKSGNDAIDISDAELALRAWVQAADFGLMLNEAQPTPVLPGTTVVTQSSLSQASVKLDISVSPFAIDMSSIPGLRLTSLKSSGNGWTMEGMLYGR